MKVTITQKHEYMSGWTAYDMTWKTDFSGFRNKTIQSVVVATKTPFSTKIFKTWASELGYDIDALFTDVENIDEDVKKMNQLGAAFNNEYGKNLDTLNSDNQCHVRYTVTLNQNFKPIKTAFETYDIYDVEVRIEYKSGVITVILPSMGRRKNAACTRIVFSGNRMKAVYGEEEAIETLKDQIGRYIKDCDTDKKFRELPQKLMEVKKELAKYYR